MEKQINVGNQNTQQIGQNQTPQHNNIQSEEQGEQSPSQQKFPLGIKLSKKTLLVFSGFILIVLFLLIGLFWSNQRYTNRAQNPTTKNTPSPTITKNIPSPTSAISSSSLEWQVFKDENVEYKYPKIWVQSSEAPQRFQSLIEISGSCKPLVFQDQNNLDVILVVENYPQPLQKYLPSCWSKGTLFGSTPNSRAIKIGEKADKIDIMQLSTGSSKYILERYGFESDYTAVNAYMFSIIFPQQYKGEIEPIFDEIVTSFKYLKQYQVTEPKEWKTYTSKLGFSFEYPSEWGDVKEEIIDYGNDPNKGESGKSYGLSFSVKSNVGFQRVAYGAGRSFDYAAARGAIFTDYKGDSQKPASITSEITVGLTYRCYQYPVQYYPYRGVVRFNLPGREISGVMLIVPILSPTDMEKYDKIVEDFINQEESCKNLIGTKSPTVIAKEKEIVNMLNNGVNFDKESQINLTIFKRISGSAKIL